MAHIKEIKTAEFEEAVVKHAGVTIVDFWAPWCGYCVRMMPVFEGLAEELAGKVSFVKVNTDEEPDLARAYNVEVLPTFAVVKNGEVVNRKIGFIPTAELKKVIEEAL